MLARFFLALALPAVALAQIQVSYVPTSGSPQILTNGTTVNVGSFPAGITSSLEFQVANETDIPIVNVEDGLYYTLATPLPTAIPPGGTFTFVVSFTPPGPPSPILPQYPIILTVDAFSVELIANAVGMPTVGDTTGATWLAGDVIGLPQTEVGKSYTKTFTLLNPYMSSLTISSFSVTGAAFSASGITAPITLAPNQTQAFQLTFTPTLPDTNSGSLVINGQSFGLSGQGYQQALPAATIQLSGANTSGQQATLAIQLASAAPAAGAGTLTMSFKPSAPNTPDDPAIQFVDNGSRTIGVQVQEGSSTANCGAGSTCTFQTGTTAGTISFTLSLGTQTAQASATIAPTVVSLDTTTARIDGSGIEVTLDGFDNTHSASNLSFTFYDVSGKELSGGVIPVQAGSQFTQFFGANAAQTGGLFQLQALFPVNGDATQLGSVSVTVTNAAGTSQSVQTQISE